LSLTLIISGDADTWKSRVGTVKLNLELNRTRTMELGLIGPQYLDAPSSPVVGSTIVLGDLGLGVGYFGGYINGVAGAETPRRDKVTRALSCVDGNALLARRTFTGSWDNVNAGNIMSEIIDTIFSDDGLLHNSVVSGPVLPHFECSGAYVNDIFDQICAASLKATSPVTPDDAGYAYFIDGSGDLHFFSVLDGIGAASFSIADSTPVYLMEPPPSLKEDLSKYANRVTVRVGALLGTGTTVSDLIHGDGATRTFTTSSPIGSLPVVKLDTGSGDVEQTVGIDGDTGKQFYYSLNSDTLTQDSGETLLISTDDLTVEFTPILTTGFITKNNEDEQAARRVIEGGSGIHELVVDNANLGTVNDADSFCEALLNQYSRVAKTLTFSMDKNQDIPEPGQIVSVTLVRYGLTAAPMMIQRVSGEFLDARGSHHLLGNITGGFWRWTIEATNGGYQPGWEKALYGDQSSAAVSSGSSTSGDVIPSYFS
jgi:hypothetical protein